MSERKPYTGSTRTLLIGIDVGTTYSGVSYSILDPGEVPEIKHVTRFPAQSRVGADSKIPSIIYYDSAGKPQAFGAEALHEATVAQAHEEQWTKVEWFKLLLSKSADVKKVLAPLPPGTTIVSVFADYFRYLFRCVEDYVVDTHHNGPSIWSRVRSGDVHFVVTHPNAWEGRQQSKLRQAAVQAGLIPDTPSGQKRLQFVTEGEASLHFCLQQGVDVNLIRPNKGILIIDAGGGTIDLSAYAPVSFKGTTGFEEIAIPHCQFNGSVFVSLEARKHLSMKLKGSKFAEDMEDIVQCFDSTTKLCFRNDKEPSFIKFGRVKDHDPMFGIRNGQIKLSGKEVASFFEPSVKSIINSVTSIGLDASHSISTAFLVGGFAASEWLLSSLRTYFEPLGINIRRPDTHVNKAVSNGAIGYHIDHKVSVRVARYDYGVECMTPFQPNRPDHFRRLSALTTGIEGDALLPQSFSVIIKKHTKVSETKTFRRVYSGLFKGYLGNFIPSFTDDIFQYVGLEDDVSWMDEEPDNFLPMCSIQMASDTVSRIARQHLNSDGEHYFKANYNILLNFGSTEFTAQFSWIEDGVEQRSPAKVVYLDAQDPVIYGGLNDKDGSCVGDTRDNKRKILD